MEVLSWGDRRRLIKLERIGKRFHLSVVKFFSKMPYLRLNLELQTWYLFDIKKYNIYTIIAYFISGAEALVILAGTAMVYIVDRFSRVN